MSFGIPVRNGLGVGLLASTSLSTRNSVVAAFSPASLFASSEPGAWYDPSDLTTMFQDTAGTTPVTATGQTVGLLLDKSQGLVLGPELVTNGDFSSATGWTLSGSASIGAGELSLPAGSDARQTIGIVAGQSYEVTIVRGGSAILVVLLGALGSGGLSSFQINTAGTYRFVLNAAGSSPGLLRINNVSGAATGTVDNITVKLLPGNHATQATAASRPIYGIEPFGGRRNLLTFTEQFDNAAWRKAATTVTENATLAPDGTATADALLETTANTFHSIVTDATVIGAANGQTYTASFYAKANGRTKGYISVVNGGGFAIFDLGAKTIVFGGNGINETVTAQTITELPNGWFRLTITSSFTGSREVKPTFGISNDAGVSSYAGDITKGYFLWGAQLETGTTATAYQRVTDQWNVTQAGVASVSYLAFDGTDDFMLTGTITPGIDKAQVFAGVRKLSEAATGIVAELSSNWNSNSGSVFIAAPSTTFAYGSGSRGDGIVATTQVATTSVGISPDTAVLAATHDIASDLSTIRRNGVLGTNGTGDKGAGNFLAYPLYIGRRAGTSLPFNGRIYSLIVRFGANLAAGTITQTETWVNGKTGAY